MININSIDTDEKLLEFINEISNDKGLYDILVPISGGKDGLYLLDFLAKRTNKKILAFNYDNGYISSITKSNTEKILKNVLCDSMTYKLAWPMTKAINKELIMKMGEICFGCEMILNLIVMKVAVFLKIPVVAWGLSPGQMKQKGILNPVIKTNEKYENNILEFYSQISKNMDFSRDILNYLNKNMLKKYENDDNDFPYYIYPYFYMHYDPYKIEEFLKTEYQWIRPFDTGGASSNCVINQLHIYLKKKIKGKDFYKKMLDSKLESNELTQEVYRNSLCDNEDLREIENILEELDIEMTVEEIINILKNQKVNAYIRSQSNISI